MAWFDCAQRKPISVNFGGTMQRNIGLVLHHAVMNGSLQGFFNNPSAQVSAHFWVSKSGVIEQYVDSNARAWHGMSLNDSYCGVETEGCVNPPHAEPMTDAMVRGLATLYSEGMRRHGWQNRLANADGQPGFGFHRMAVNTACPCDIRLNRRSEILALAAGKPVTPTPTPPPALEGDIMAVQTHNCRNNEFTFQVNKAGQLYRKVRGQVSNPGRAESYNNALVSQMVWGGNTDVKVQPNSLHVEGDDNGVSVFVELDPTTVVRRYIFGDNHDKPSAVDLP